MTSPDPVATPPQAITAATEWLHDEECDDGDTETCGRWKCGSDPGSQFHSYHVGHVNFYRERATGVLEAAAPHLAASEHAELENLRHALKEAGKGMDRRYEMGVTAGRAACVRHLQTTSAADLLDRHGLARSAGAHHVLAAAASDLLREQP